MFSVGSVHYTERHDISNHVRHDSLLNRVFRRRSKKTSKLRVIGFVGGTRRWSVNSPHKGPVTRKMFPFDEVIMISPVFLFCRLRATGEWVGDQQERSQHHGQKCRGCHLRWIDVLAFWIRTQFWYRTRMEQCLLWLGALTFGTG